MQVEAHLCAYMQNVPNSECLGRKMAYAREALAKFVSEEYKNGFSNSNLLLILAIAHVRAKR